MTMLTQAPKGTRDVLPADSYRWQFIEDKMRKAAALAGYREVRTPVFEHTELYALCSYRKVNAYCDKKQRNYVRLVEDVVHK